MDWNITAEDQKKAGKIAARAVKLGLARVPQDVEMDVTATHLNGCVLDLDRLLEFPEGDFIHDIRGIERHLDRTSGELTDCFLPRCHAK